MVVGRCWVRIVLSGVEEMVPSDDCFGPHRDQFSVSSDLMEHEWRGGEGDEENCDSYGGSQRMERKLSAFLEAGVAWPLGSSASKIIRG